LIVFHCKATFCPLHSTSPIFFWTFYRKYNFCRSHLGFPFWDFMIFFNFVQMFPTSKLWSESISVPRITCTSFTLFLNRCITFM
jgi:hypothetical protein